MSLFTRFALFVVFCCVVSTRAQGDGSWWQLPQVRACCSEADAVYADRWELRDGKLTVEVTGGGPRDHAWAPIGRVFEVPQEKVIQAPGNPTGRALLFLRPTDLYVYCFLPGALI